MRGWTPAPVHRSRLFSLNEGLSVPIVFDLGPQPPQPPERPKILDAAGPSPADIARGRTDGNPEIEPTLRRYNEALQNYERELQTYRAERAQWERERGGGAMEISTTQADIVECGHGRYVTRLPDGVKPGRRSGLNRIILS
jgi:hypothetical protein